MSSRGSMWRERVMVRPSVVGRMTSTILRVLNLSMIWRGVRPGARARAMARSVASRHNAMNAAKDAVVETVVDGAQAEVILEFAEGVFDLALDHVLLPEGLRGAVGEVGAQQVGAFVLRAGFADTRPVEVPGEGGRRDRFTLLREGDMDQAPGAAGLGLGDGKAADQFVAPRERARAQQLRHRRLRHPAAVHPQFAARGGQAVHHDALEDGQPVRPFAARFEPRRPELVQTEPLPQFQPQPHLPPVAKVLHRQLVHPHLHDVPAAVLRGRTVGREELELAGAPLLVERLDGPLPFRPLRIVQLTEVQRPPLEHAPPNANVLDQRPVEMELPVLVSFDGSQKHGGILARPFSDARG